MTPLALQAFSQLKLFLITHSSQLDSVIPATILKRDKAMQAGFAYLAKRR